LIYILSKQNISDSNKDIKLLINKLIKEVTNDINSFKYNTAIAKLMKAINDLWGRSIDEYDKSVLLALVAPFVGDNSQRKWPEADEKYLKDEITLVPIAVNGKVRAQIEVDSNMTKEDVIKRSTEMLTDWIKDKKVIKEIYVPLKMVNLVLG